LSLGGRFAEHRGEWYFPKGTRVDVILRAARVVETSGNGHDADGHSEIETEGLFDPLVEEVEEHGVEVDVEDSPRRQAVARAVKAWTDQLIDRSARNNLLFFRDQRAGTLDLTTTPPRPMFDILAGRSRHLAQLFPADQEALADAARRARTIHNKAQAIYEERGIHTLYLACGLATWDNQHGTAEPAAPVLLAPATLTARGAAQQEFDLQVTGELEVNPTLLNALAAEFDVECDPEELLASAGMEGAIDTPEELEIAYAWLTAKAARIPDFAVRPKTVLGNFSYAKLPMVRDLQGSVEALTGHDLIAALAGDAEARQAVRDRRLEVDPTQPDHTSPPDEFLVLDADSSQNFAINKVLGGQDLVIKGPPGTGKSQTISNLISCLIARGKTVLFVAEKRAPWGLSLFAAEERLLALGEEAQTEVRLRGEKLHVLTADDLERAREDLREFVGLGGLQAASASPWAGSPLTTRQQVARALDLVDDLALRRLEPLLDRLERASASLGMTVPDTVHGWTDRLVLWSGTRDTLEHFGAELFDEDLQSLVERLAPLGEGAGTRMSAAMSDGDYRAAHKRAKSLQRDGVKLRKAGLLDALQAAADQQRQWSSAGGDVPPRALEKLDALLADHAVTMEALEELSSLAGTDVADGLRPAVVDRLHALRGDAATLGRLPDLHRLRGTLDAAGLTELVNDLTIWTPDVEGALDTFEFCLMASIVDDIRLGDRRVGGFDGHQHSSTVEDFQHADRRHIATTAQRVRRLAAERARRIGDEEPDQATLVKREAAKKSRHLPVRETFRMAPEVMTSIKPCWVMSPLVVSQVLPNDRPYFDVVIFDEASQVRPAEAIPAIARGRRLVVAGDEKQLPPTDFFSGPVIVTDDGDDATLAAVGSDFESVLDVLEYLVEPRMLEWHYRSADERLIAFSNAHLYGKALLTFPGVSGPECLHHVHVPFTPGQPDGEDTSNAEVLKVVELILEHAEEHSQQSLGVIALGIKHADRVDGALRNALRDRSDLDEFFDENHPERFFIKNLERVQGDERDAIILTVGYGKGADGQMVYRFGPLNEEGGERRLNVAVTRARRRVTAVSSFTAADMDPERTKRGGDLLRLYLAYAESRGEKLDRQAAESPELNAFELDIYNALDKAGIPLICQHGVGRYRLDFAAKHPEKRGRLVLAIEADGASYHSANTARDRDRLRQEQLERLGWRFHRIWSQDWFTDRKGEVEKAVAAYHAAVVASEETAAVPRSTVAAPPPPPIAPRDKGRGPRPNIYGWGPIDEFTDADLESMVRWIESDTLLRSREDVIAEVMAELGFERRGKKIVSRIGAAIDAVRRPRS
jgi:very-short-patch-repair endonuclease